MRWFMNRPNPVVPPKKIAHHITEASVISGLSRSTLYKLIAAKELRTVKIGRRRLILHEDLESLLLTAAK
jgi:excisionase family DNA binding protein